MVEVLYFAMRELGLESQFPHVFCITKGGDYKILDKGEFYVFDGTFKPSRYHAENFYYIENCLTHGIAMFANKNDCLTSQADRSNHSLEIDRILGYEEEYANYFSKRDTSAKKADLSAHSALTSNASLSGSRVWGYPNHMSYHGRVNMEDWPLEQLENWFVSATYAQTIGRQAERTTAQSTTQRSINNWYPTDDHIF